MNQNLNQKIYYKKLNPQEFEKVISEIKESLLSVVQKHFQAKNFNFQVIVIPRIPIKNNKNKTPP